MARRTELESALYWYAQEKKWYEEHGGGLMGYIARYGSAQDPQHYGDGGEAIHAADLAKLEQCEQRAMRALARDAKRRARAAR